MFPHPVRIVLSYPLPPNYHIGLKSKNRSTDSPNKYSTIVPLLDRFGAIYSLLYIYIYIYIYSEICSPELGKGGTPYITNSPWNDWLGQQSFQQGGVGVSPKDSGSWVCSLLSHLIANFDWQQHWIWDRNNLLSSQITLPEHPTCHRKNILAMQGTLLLDTPICAAWPIHIFGCSFGRGKCDVHGK